MISANPKQKVLDKIRYHTGNTILKTVWDPVYNGYKKHPLAEARQAAKISRLYDALQFTCGNIYNMINDTLKEHDFSGKND